MSNGNQQSHTAGVILAAGYSTLSDGTPKVLAELNGRPIVQRAIESHLAAGFTKVVVVVNHRDDALIRKTVNAARYGSDVIWCQQPERFGTADALRHAIHALGVSGTWVGRLVVSMGDFGLWQPETMWDLVTAHLDQKSYRCMGMSMATVALRHHPRVFRNYGLIIHAGKDASQPGCPKLVKNYWADGGGDGIPLEPMVTPGLFCFEWPWVVRRLASLPLHASRDPGLPPEQCLTDLVEEGYRDEWPAHELVLPAERAHEALKVNDDDDLRYVQKVIAKIQEPVWEI